MYYQPDPIWGIFNVNSHQEYIHKFVVKGRFHSNVHEDVVKSYSVVEHIMALSYYHYPMYDVALQKLLGIYEMAVKLRCKQVGVNLSKGDTNETSKTKRKNLHTLIEELIKSNLTPEFTGVLLNLKELRNVLAHPEDDSLMGSLCLSAIIPLVNILNQIYLPQSHHVENFEEFKKAKEKFNFLQNKPFVLEHKQKRILVYNPKLMDTFKVGNDWIRAVSFQPVLLNTKKMLSDHTIPNGIIRFFKEVQIIHSGIRAVDMELTEEILIEKTFNAENLDKLETHLSELNELDIRDHIAHLHSMEDGIDREIQKFIFENCWN